MWKKILAFDGEQTIIRQKDALGRSERIESCDSSYCDCWGQNFQGIQGAEEILSRIGTHHTTLGIDDNELGTPGLVRIIDGLEKGRASIALSEHRALGISNIEAAYCDLTDEGVEAIMAYAARDAILRSVQLERNGLELQSNIDSIITSINSSHLTTVNLSRNPLPPTNLIRLFATLDSPHLSTLNMYGCCRGDLDVAEAIAQYIRSKRSRALRHLLLDANDFLSEAVGVIVDALDVGNITLQSLTIMSSDYKTKVYMDIRVYVMSNEEANALRHEYERMTVLLARNQALANRVKLAALTCLPRARILLNACPIPHLDQQTPNSDHSVYVDTPLPTGTFLCLPLEVKEQIVRHTTQDVGALSAAQHRRLRQSASGTEGLQRAVRAARILAAVRKSGQNDGPISLLEHQLADEWLLSERLSGCEEEIPAEV